MVKDVFYYYNMPLFIWGFFRKRHAVTKVRSMDASEKSLVLNEAIRPFGFTYLPEQDIITSALDAWQREFGYCTFLMKQLRILTWYLIASLFILIMMTVHG